MMEVCIVGAGVIGLSTAVSLQERMASSTECNVTIMADRFDRHTTSFGSGGQIVSFPPPGVPENISSQWCQDSSQHFFSLAFSPEASEAGVNLVSGFQLTDNDERPPYLDCLLNVKKMDSSELQRFGKTFRNGYTATSPLVEMPIYMQWLTDKFVSQGGKLVEKHVSSLEELSGHYDVIVNCTGLGSRTLVNDPLMRPVRGQVLHLKAPWIKHFVRVDASMHIFPFRDSVFVGSVKQQNNDSLVISPEDSQFMLKRAQEVFPPLKGARVLWEWVGIRPQRDVIRLERESWTTSEGKQLKVVHNYGHGSFGVSLSWGSAVHAARLVQDALKEKTPAAKL